MNRLGILELVLYVVYVVSVLWFMTREDIKTKYKLVLRLIIIVAAGYLYVWLYNSWLLLIN